MDTRTCDCAHGFPFCCCSEGFTGEALLARSRRASAIIGWPTKHYVPAAVARHNAKMAEAMENRRLRLAALRRAAKPRIPLGVRFGSAEGGA